MKVAVIGGGITGLTTAYHLAKHGVEVTLFEQSKSIGGLAGAIKVSSWYLEKYYHHIFKSDLFILDLVKELGLAEEIIWKDSKVGFLCNNEIIPFTTTFDLLKFRPLSFLERLKLGFSVFYFKSITNWKKLDEITIADWYGSKRMDNIYKVVWEPLLKSKFGDGYSNISSAWLWGRIHPRAKSRSKGKEQLGYLKGGFQIFLLKLKDKIEKLGGILKLNDKVVRIHTENGVFNLKTEKDTMAFDKIVATIPLPKLLNMVTDFPESFANELKLINYRAVECLVLFLEQPLSDFYWLNICDEDIPFGGIIEHTNFIPPEHYDDVNIVYLFRYLNTNYSDTFTRTKKDLIDSYLSSLKKIFPFFGSSLIKTSYLFRDMYATPIYSTNYAQRKPDYYTPIKNLYLANTSQIYPEDRTMNNCVGIGNKVAEIVMSG